MNITDNYFDSRFKFDKDRTIVWQALSEFFQLRIADNGSILDLGAGYCDFINNISASHKFALDMSPHTKEYVSKDVHLLEQSVLQKWPINDTSLDAVFASNFFEHFTDEELTFIMSEIKRILKPGGRLLLMQPNYYYAYREYWDDYTHKKAFSHVSLSDFLKSYGLKPIEIQARFVPFSMKSKLPKSYWLTKLYLHSPIKPMAKQMFVMAEK